MKEITEEEKRLINRLLIVERFKVQHTRNLDKSKHEDTDKKLILIDDLFNKINSK